MYPPWRLGISLLKTQTQYPERLEDSLFFDSLDIINVGFFDS